MVFDSEKMPSPSCLFLFGMPGMPITLKAHDRYWDLEGQSTGVSCLTMQNKMGYEWVRLAWTGISAEARILEWSSRRSFGGFHIWAYSNHSSSFAFALAVYTRRKWQNVCMSKVTANEAGRWWSLMNGFCSPRWCMLSLHITANIFQIRFAVCFQCRLRHGDNHPLDDMPFPGIPMYSNGHRRSKKSPFTLIWDLVVQELFSSTCCPHPHSKNLPMSQQEKRSMKHPLFLIALRSFSFNYKQNTSKHVVD